MKKNYLTQDNLEKSMCAKKQDRSFLSMMILLMVSFLFGSAFAQGALSLQEPVLAKTPWASKNIKNELTNKRTRTSKSFLTSENRTTAFISPNSIHYLGESNQWLDINTAIIPNQGANANSHPFASTENAVKTWFPSNPFTQYLVMSSKEGSFKEKVVAIQFLDNNNQVISSLPINGNIQSNVLGNKISYSGFNQHLTLEYTLGNDSRKFNVVINSNAFFNSIPAGATSIAILEEFLTENNNSRIETATNEIHVYSNGTKVFNIPEPTAFDANPQADEFLPGVLKVKLNGKEAVITTMFDLAWITNNARQFPVLLDPTVNYYPQNSNYWSGYQTSSTGKSNGFLRLTSSTTAAWAKFDLSTLPVGCTVTQADYYGYHYTTTSTTKFAEIHGLGALDPVTAAASTLFTQSHNGTLYNSSFTWGGSTYGWHNGTFNATGMSDVASAAGSWIGLGFAYASGSTTFMYHYGNNATSNTCYLEVTYFTVPCSTVPSANSAVTPTYEVCPGTMVNLSLANTYSVGGITYQWQSSTTSSVGPFTAIAGATNAAVTTPTLGASTWFNALITCSNTTGTTTASVGQVSVQATTTNSIPYSVSFEAINSENSLPNCSWSSPSLGSTALTYTAANTLGRVPRTGSKFASFYYNPVGVKYFYSNGLQLVSGVTYSASLWYRTEYYGYTNWSDLSILIGTTQSTTGLVNVASTNGAATSATYKLLSGTFTVPTTGIYYVAIRGTNTTSGAQYLTFDDLKVTKPCSINAPTLALNSSTTTICAGNAVNFTATGANTYIWNTGATGSSITETLTESTTIEVVGTDILSGCTSVESQFIVVNPSPIIYVYANPNSVCAGSQANISVIGGNPSYTYLWSDGSTNAVTMVTPTVSSSYTVIATNNFGCNGTAAANVDVNDLPTVQVTSSSPAQMCVGESVQLTATGAETYFWVSSVTSELSSGVTITKSPLVTTTYSVTGTDEFGCASTITFEQVVSECTGLNQITNNTVILTLYPNPTHGNFTIGFNSNLEKTIVVTDLTGRTILAETTDSQSHQLNLSRYSNGIYYVTVKTELGSEVMKVVKD